MSLITENIIYILLISFVINYCESADEISVTIKPKQFIGLKKTVDGKEIDYFLGIPYAEPPIGKLRFKKPNPFKYDKPINATNWGNVCFQNVDRNSPQFSSHNMSEDCLYLNIWSPKITKELKPVMFWIHGGALVTGSASSEFSSGDLLASRGDVVVVTINYRVQAFGFLYTGTEDAPGNVGLWDQALALQWVKNNIQTFGGDPEQITIFGESAGSWSVGLHLLSPITRNLYKNAIMMSAGPLSHLTGEHPETAKNNWLKVANFAECEGKNFTSTVIQCLQNISPEKLVKAGDRKELTTDTMGFMSQVRYGDEFLPQEPIEMLKRRDHKTNVRLLAGFTDDEGSWILGGIVDPIKYALKNPSNLTKTQAFEELKQLSNRFITHYKSVNGEEAAKLYLSRLQNTDYDTIRRTIGVALGDFYIACTTDLFAKALYENDKNYTKVYQYYFTAKLKNALIESYCAEWQGTCHGTDSIPLFGVSLKTPELFSNEEKEVSKKMIDTFTYFAKNGHPPPQEGIEWPEYYTLNNHVIKHYYEFTNNPKPTGNFGYGLKTDECEKLWKPFIYP